MQPGPSETYRVTWSSAFDTDWDAGLASGWLNPMVHPSQVAYFTRTVLPRMPYAGGPAPGEPANYRTIRFPHSPRGDAVIQIIYSIVEDDRIVTLERIRLIA